MYVYVCMFVCMYVLVCVHICGVCPCVHLYMYAHKCIFVYLCVCGVHMHIDVLKNPLQVMSFYGTGVIGSYNRPNVVAHN